MYSNIIASTPVNYISSLHISNIHKSFGPTQGFDFSGGIMSYAAPESSEASQGLYDSSYDGSRVNGELQGGLGRLVDGEFGADNFRLDIGYGKGNGWISWKNDSVPNGYVELTFEFDQIRNFTEVHLFTNNFFSRNVQVSVYDNLASISLVFKNLV
ncbi:hypothetical protein Zmor_005805 [Zophobas morio]|uniref:Discoidin domain-containing protein n=1 Tax=Zophobas morio TaxID=2755281 RepID=A0AA38IYF7_9CUCU|nr:hypothetical protein Zmor_005805 [Zophobas morio]